MVYVWVLRQLHNVVKGSTIYLLASTKWYHSLNVSIERTSGQDGDTGTTEEEPKAPVIIEQPPHRVVAMIGDDLTLPLKVKGELPLRY